MHFTEVTILSFNTTWQIPNKAKRYHLVDSRLVFCLLPSLFDVIANANCLRNGYIFINWFIKRQRP